MAPKKRAHGGRRAGAGRKPKEFTAFKREVIKAKLDDALEAWEFIKATMNDKKTSRGVRLQAAFYIVDQVIGKPTQPLEHGGEVPLLIVDD